MKKFAKLRQLLFDYEEEKRRKLYDEKLDLGAHHFLSNRISSATQTSKFSKQVVIKLLSNLSASGVKNALNYVIRNSESEFAINQDGKSVSLNEVMKEWSKDFSSKLNAKEAWHFTFSLDEDVSENALKVLQDSVTEVMQKNFYEYKYVSVVHTHQHKPHMHIILNKNNIFTQKKLHFASKQAIKDFWNALREDFKNALLFYNPNLNYTNKYKFERDLLKESANAKIETPLNINQEITKSMQSLQNKTDLYERKRSKLREKISALIKQKRELITLTKELIAINNKRYFQTLKSIKTLNQEIKTLQTQTLAYAKDMQILKTHIKELNYERLSYKYEYSTLAKKQAYLRFLESKVAPKSKSDVYLITKIKSDLALNAQNLAYSFEDNLKADLFLSRSLNKKSNAFSMMNLARDLDSHLSALSKLDVSVELSEKLQSYEQILKSNQKFVLELCAQKLQYLNEGFLKGKKSPYRQKELQALQVFFNQPQSIHSQVPKDSSPSLSTERKQTPKSQNPSELGSLNIDGFLQWYCKKQDIRNIGFYEANLREKINNGAFENFKMLYREFEQERDRGMGR